MVFRIGVDLMGSDCSPASLFEAVILATQRFSDIEVISFVTQPAKEEIFSLYSEQSRILSSLPFDLSPQFIEMGDEPLQSIRSKKKSTMLRGLECLKEGHLDAFVTAGNTGALIAGATLKLPLFFGVKRPALLATLPSETGFVVLLDVGGNVSCKAPQLIQFALMGAAYHQCQTGNMFSRVGLLNIGVESKKGSIEERTAYEQLSQLAAEKKIHFVGNIEGRNLFQGVADVVVTNGFSGNVVLKTSEGVSHLIMNKLAQALTVLAPEKAREIIETIQFQLDPEEYYGALVCGIDGIVIKCHGQSTSRGLFNGIRGAIQLARQQFISRMKAKLQSNLV